MGDERQLMRASIQWMRQKYQEMNQRLFNSSLGDCDFEIFTSGKGSQGGVLGWFCVDGGNKVLKADRTNRRIYVINNLLPNGKEWVNKKNFVEICHPKIKLNGNYSGTEKSLLATLIHEMCHYYTYMYGFLPRQSHGTDFRNIAMIVADRSNGEFTIEKVATAEEMKGYELDQQFKEKKQKRLENKKAKTTIVAVFMKNGTVRLVNASSQNLVDDIIQYHTKRNDASKIMVSNDANLVNKFFENGYRTVFRTYGRYYDITQNNDLISALEDKEHYNVSEKSILSLKHLTEMISEVITDYMSKLSQQSLPNDDIDIPNGINLGIVTIN